VTVHAITTTDQREHDPTSRHVAWLETVYDHEPERFAGAWDRTLLELVALADRRDYATWPEIWHGARRIARAYLRWWDFLTPERRDLALRQGFDPDLLANARQLAGPTGDLPTVEAAPEGGGAG
jgi:hypothetical protein